MDIVGEKARLRAVQKAQRQQLSPSWCASATKALLHNLRPWIHEGSTVALFRSMPGEPAIDQYMTEWPFQLVLPRVVHDQLVLHRWQGQECRQSRFGILEPSPEWEVIAPANIDLFLVPGLAFDRQGGRLGFGRGFYDRLLPQSRGQRIGIGWENQLVDWVAMEPHDGRMDGLVTEKRFYSFSP